MFLFFKLINLVSTYAQHTEDTSQIHVLKKTNKKIEGEGVNKSTTHVHVKCS